MTSLSRAADLPQTDANLAAKVARTQGLLLVEEARRLTPEQWGTITECPRWTVFDMVAHVTAATQNAANPLRWIRDGVVGKLQHPHDAFLDAANEVGIDHRRGHPVSGLLADLARWIDVPKSPKILRRVPVPVSGLPRYGDVGYLVDVILARDTWLHRHDIARATNSTTTPDPTSAEVVAPVVRDLALAWHGPGIVLTLTGAEGGTWLIGTDRDAFTASLPAVEFLRHLSGRHVRQEVWGCGSRRGACIPRIGPCDVLIAGDERNARSDLVRPSAVRTPACAR